MKLRRAWPAICIWVVFVIFEIVMVASCSYFSGLFPSENLLIYTGVFTVLSILAMNVLTFALGRLSDSLMAHQFKEKTGFKFLYAVLMCLILVGGVWYRLEMMADYVGDVTGKFSLYENAMVGGQNLKPEYDLLSVFYSTILKFILFFTGNIITVPFFFQIACFTIFMVCGFFTVKHLLGMSAAFVFSAYVAFVPIFTIAFTGLELSTDSLFMAMFGIELLVVGQYLKGAYKGLYKSRLWIFGYIIVGAVVGFMAYVDAGTIIMILPFLLATLALYGRSTKKEAIRLIFVVVPAVIAFFAMIAQEAGIGMIGQRLENWAGYYFHNLNTFSMFWTYTDHKLLYLITVIAMSGVIVGFWKNRKVEKISPWLLSMLFIFATVPFMGATRMNTQVFVTIYYAFILGCVSSLITMMADETGDYETEEAPAEADGELEAEMGESEQEDTRTSETQAQIAEVVEPEKAEEPEEPVAEPSPEEAVEEPEVAPEAEAQTTPVEEPEEETEPAYTYSTKVAAAAIAAKVLKDEYEFQDDAEADEYEDEEELEEVEFHDDEEEAAEPAPASSPLQASEAAPEKRFVPEGMVLPEDDADADMTPRMKMPENRTLSGKGGKTEKLRISRNKTEARPKTPKDDFDIELRPGDDFDL